MITSIRQIETIVDFPGVQPVCWLVHRGVLGFRSTQLTYMYIYIYVVIHAVERTTQIRFWEQRIEGL